MAMAVTPSSISLPIGQLDWSQWVSLEEASLKLDLNGGHLRRLCSAELLGQGLAMFVRGPQGGKARWWIARRWNLKLAPGEIGSLYQVGDLSRFPAAKRQTAMARRECVVALREAKASRTGLMAHWLPHLVEELKSRHVIAISRSTLLRWDSLYRTPSDLVKLVDSRGGDQTSGGDAKAWAYFRDCYLDARRPSIAECWRQTRLWAQAQNLPWCSARTCVRKLDEVITPEQQAYHRDPTLWRMKFAPFIKQDPNRFPAGRCWVGDHTQLDFWVRHGNQVIRPWVTVWQDWRTRRIAGWVISPSPNSDTILAALRAGLVDERNMGGPTEVVIDNGRDYDSWMFHGQTKAERQSRILERGYIDESRFLGIFGLLNITPHFSLAYSPNGKARMERWFGSLHGQFDKSFPTYCGASPESRPDGLADMLAAGRNIPAFSHVASRMATFIAAFNASADHQMEDMEDDGVRLSPDQAMSTWCTSKLMPKDPGVMDLLLQHWSKPVSVGRNGVTIAPYGVSLTFGWNSSVLSGFKGTGKKVYVAFDADDLRKVRVYDDALRFLCEAEANEFGGSPQSVGREHVSKLLAQKRRYTKALKEVASGQHHEYLSSAEILAAGLQEPPTPQPEPTSLQIRRMPEVAQSEELKLAVGAESGIDPSLADMGMARVSDLAGCLDTTDSRDPLPFDDDDLSPSHLLDDGNDKGNEDVSPWSDFAKDDDHG